MQIYELAKDVEQYVIDMRRHFHTHPELSDKEENTVARIAQELEALGVSYEIVPKGGVLATIEGTKPGNGKTVLLRADVDALPLQENENNLAGPRVCMSEVPNVMHACGHDGHTAMLLGAAKILNDHRDEIPGKVVLMFERGEEVTGNQGYILAYMEKHGYKVDGCWGIHLYAMLESGKVGIITGGAMSAATGFDVTIKGKGGHGSRPDQANSPVDCFVAIYNGIQAARMRKVSPFETLTFSVGKLQGGLQGNVIPNEVTFGGTVRCFDRDAAGVPFRDEMVKIIDNICAAYGCTPVYNKMSGPHYGVINDAECADLARKAVTKAMGADRLGKVEPWMASESFSTLQKLWPGVLAFVGVQNPEKGTGAAHHNEYFDLDEDALKYGVASSVAYALEFLESDIDTSDRTWKGTLKECYLAGGRDWEDVADYFAD